MNKKQLISDVVFVKPTLEESSDNQFRIKGIFQRADIVNENNRIYPRKVLEKAVNKFKEKIKERRSVGVAEHPADGKTKVYDITHLITNIEINDKGEVIGEAVILDTSKGKDLKIIIESGVKIGISSRGFGTLKQKVVEGKTIYEVQDDYELEAFDIVYDPSTPGAFLNESKGDEKMYTKEQFEKFAKDLIEKTQEIVENIVEEEKEKLLSENIDAKEKMALTAIVKILEPLVPEISESMEIANEKIIEEMQETIKQLKESNERLELEKYKLEKIAESHEPEKLKSLIAEARTKEEVDKTIEEYKKRKMLQDPTPIKQDINEASIQRKRFFSKFTGINII